jgi:hypothetical protein
MPYQKNILGFLDPWRWDRYVVPKHQLGINALRYAITQGSADLIYMAVEA